MIARKVNFIFAMILHFQLPLAKKKDKKRRKDLKKSIAINIVWLEYHVKRKLAYLKGQGF